MHIILYKVSVLVDIIDPVRPVSAREGRDVEMSCRLSQPDIKEGEWLKGAVTLRTSERIEIGDRGDTQYLKIQRVEKGDFDVYTYKIGNVSTSSLFSTVRK